MSTDYGVMQKVLAENIVEKTATVYTRYSESDVWRVIDGLHVVGELIDALDGFDVDKNWLSAVRVVGVVPLNCAKFAHVLRSTVVVLQRHSLQQIKRNTYT